MFQGIIYGKSGIPEDWASYLGDLIITVAIDRTGIKYELPETCTELTKRIMDMIPVMFKVHGIEMEYTDGESDISDETATAVCAGIENMLFNRLPYSYNAPYCVHTSAIVEFYGQPVIAPDESIKVRIRFFNKMCDQRHLHIKLYLPDGWSASAYKRDVHLNKASYKETVPGHEWEVTLTAGNNVEAMNRAVVEVTSPGRPNALLIPITIAG